ncbi:hypothetical protein D3C78_906400 [compost metagenome]
MLTQERTITRNRRGPLKALQIALPPLARLGHVLVLQPANVVTIARCRGQLRLPPLAHCRVDLEEVIHQQGSAPGIDEDVVVAHHEPVACRADTDQAQVERRLVEQVEAGLAFCLEQGLQLGLLLIFGHRAPVQELDRGAARRVDNLQHLRTDVPAERGTQGFVPSDHRLPRLGESLRIEFAVDTVAVLHVVQAGARFQQGVQQHAFLHRRERVQVLNLRGGNRQLIELHLGQLRQREI